MQDLKGIIGCTRERVNTTHHMTTWALPNQLTYQLVSYLGIVNSFPCQTLSPMAHAGIMYRRNLVVYFVSY